MAVCAVPADPNELKDSRIVIHSSTKSKIKKNNNQQLLWLSIDATNAI
jgi:hypothetical protein